MESVADETGKLLSSLSEEVSPSQSNENTNVDEEGEDGEKIPKKKSNKATETLEKNAENLNLKSFDLEWNIDPLFKKTCADFDEGGAKGLLMNNLSIDGLIRLRLDASDAKLDDQNDCQALNTNLDLSRLKEFRTLLMKAQDYEICPTFSNFDSKQPLSSLKVPDNNMEEIFNSKPAIDFNNSLGLLSDDDVGQSMADDDEGDNFISPLNEFNDGNEETHLNRRESLIGSMVTSDENWLSYFNDVATKNWAGPEHWRIRLRRGPVEKGETVKKAPKKVTTTDFLLSETVDPSVLFARSTAAITISKANISDRMNDQHLLPEDLHFSAKNLVSLFTRPSWLIQKTPGKSSSQVEVKGSLWNIMDQSLTGAYEEASNDDFVGTIGDSLQEDSEEENEVVNEPFDVYNNEELDIGQQLVSEPRLTKILKMNYAKTAKRVDVKLLKENMWKSMAVNSSTEQKFSNVISSMASYYPPTQLQDLSVSYCFISLLHLANEKNLELKVTASNELLINK